MTYRFSAAFAALVAMNPGFAMGQTPVQVGQSDVYSLRWALPADPGKDELSRDERSQPVLSPDAQFIFRSYSNGRIEKRLTSNGEVQWVRDLGIEVRGALAYIASFDGQNSITVVDALGTLHVLSERDGTTVNTTEIGSPSDCAPQSTSSGLLFVTGDDRLVMMPAGLASLEPKWSTERVKARSMTLLGNSCPAISDSLACHGRSDGMAACYDLASGTLSWSRRLNSTSTRLAVHDVDAGPVFHNGALYAASVSGGLYRLSPETGEIVWQQDIKNLHRLGANQYGLVALSMDGQAVGFNDKGERRFVTTLPSKRLAALLVGKSLALISAGETGIVLIESERGKPIQARALGAEALSLPATVGRHLVLQDASGFLYHFELDEIGS